MAQLRVGEGAMKRTHRLKYTNVEESALESAHGSSCGCLYCKSYTQQINQQVMTSVEREGLGSMSQLNGAKSFFSLT